MGAPLGDLDGQAIQTSTVSWSASPVTEPLPSQMSTDAPSISDMPSAVATTAEPAAPVKRGPFKRTWDYFDEHLGLSALRYPVPRHANTFWYTLGGMTFIGLIVLVITGIWLAQFYNPDPAAARNSVAY